MPLLDLLTAAGRRRRRIEQALEGGRLAGGDFERLLAELQAPPPFAAEDFDLLHHLLQAAIDGMDRNWSWQQLTLLQQTMTTLAGNRQYDGDVAGLFRRLAEKSEGLGNRTLARSEATRGYLITRGAASSRTDCVLFFADKLLFDEPAKQLYRRFLSDHPPGSPESQRFFKFFADKGHIAADTPAADVPGRMPYNAGLLDLLGPQAPYAARINLALGSFILGDLKTADRIFRELLAARRGDKLAVHGLVVLAYSQRRYRAGVQIVHDVRPAGVEAKELDALEALGQAATWLSDIQPNPLANPSALLNWRKALETPFDLQHLVRGDVAFVRGRLAGILGDAQAGLAHLADAVKVNPKSGAALHAHAQALQVAGQWEEATALLAQAPNAPEFACLRLRQARHDRGADEASPPQPKGETGLTAPDLGVRLAAAQQAVLTGRAAQLPPWPGTIAFGAAEQTDTWLACWLAALLARGEAAEARRLMAAPLFLRQPLAVQKTFAALAAFVAGERAAAAPLVQEALALAPKCDVALRLAVLLADAEPGLAGGQLRQLRAANPKDHRAILQEAQVKLNLAQLDEAIDLLRPLTTSAVIAGRANFWLGLGLLLRSLDGKAADARRDSAEATACFDRALAAGHPLAGEYGWLCRAYGGRGAAWTPKQATQLLAAVPRNGDGAPANTSTPMTASTAALVAASTGRTADLFWGAGLLVARLTGRAGDAAAQARDAANLTEVLARISDALIVGEPPTPQHALLLNGWARSLEPGYPEHAAAARRIADRVLAKDIVTAAADGQDHDGSLALIEGAVKANPDSLVPNLARLAILTRQGALPQAEAAAELRSTRRDAVLAALQERVLLDGRGNGLAPCPPGAIAFLFAQRRTAGDTGPVLDALAARVRGEAPDEALVELARCMAEMNRADEALAYYDLAARRCPSDALVDEYRAYLCHLAAQWKTPRNGLPPVSVERVQELLNKAAALAQWSGPGQPIETVLGAAQDASGRPAAKKTGRRATIPPAPSASSKGAAEPSPASPAATAPPVTAAASGTASRTVLLRGLAETVAARAEHLAQQERTP